MTLATIDDAGLAWCSNIFYTYLPDSNELVFTSGEETAHGQHMLARKDVAASIVLESKIVGKLQGLQIQGIAKQDADPRYRNAFIKAFPYAAFSLKELWAVEITYAKYTDNRLGFGTKLIYTK